jgi:hypothetical protein
MRKHKLLTKALLIASVVMAGGTVLDNGCINTLASLPICGSVLTFCTPADQVNLLWPLLTTPDYNSDPSCSIPLACGSSDVLQPLAGGPGNDSSGVVQPTDSSSGGALGGGGGGV